MFKARNVARLEVEGGLANRRRIYHCKHRRQMKSLLVELLPVLASSRALDLSSIHAPVVGHFQILDDPRCYVTKCVYH